MTSPPTAAAPPGRIRSLTGLRAEYASGARTPTAVVEAVLDRIAARGDDHAWISRFPVEALHGRAAELERRALAGGIGGMPLYGVPVAVKDSIDVEGLPTTNACPDYAYLPRRSAFAIRRLIEAGAIVIGKTNLDQFATGLVGVRSPYGAPESVFGGGMISGGSSSGSAVAVAAGVVPVAIATDTAGSGRVPAALNGIVGMKPTLGLISTTGLLPACRSIDCISVMSTGVEDALAVLDVISGPDPDNPWSRPVGLRPPLIGPPRLGLPVVDDLEFFGDHAMRGAHLAARDRAVAELGASTHPVPLADFREAGALLYAGPWVAERLADLAGFLASHPDSVLPVTRSIIEGGASFSAAEAFGAQHRMAELRLAVTRLFGHVDALVLPTIGTTFTQDQVRADPIATNTMLGHYTQFANLLDLCAISLPAGRTGDGRPVSLMLLAPAGGDLVLGELARRLLGEQPPAVSPAPEEPAREVVIAFAGRHLTDRSHDGELLAHGGRDDRRRDKTEAPEASIPAEPYPFSFGLADTALVIIDMQRDFVEPGGFGETLGNDVGQLSGVVPVLRGVLEAVRGAGMLVIHTREGHLPDLSDCPPAKLTRGAPAMRIGDPGPNGRILIRGEPGHDIVPELYPVPGEPVVDKPGKGAFYATELADILRANGIRRLVVTGVTTEVCVHTTVREANDRGFECLVLSDCVGSYFPDFQRTGLRMIAAQGGIFGWVAPAATLLQALATLPTPSPVAGALPAPAPAAATLGSNR